MKKHWAHYLNYLGLLLALYMVVETHRDSRRTDNTLKVAARQQEKLRDLMWINLLEQRTTNLVQSGLMENNAEKLEEAKNVSASSETFLANVQEKYLHAIVDDESRKEVMEFQGRMKAIDEAKFHGADGRREVRQLTTLAEKAGSSLNKAESEEWFKLQKNNTKLIAELEEEQFKFESILVLFVVYLIFLGWIIARKDKAEFDLKASEGKLVNAAKMSALGEMAGGVAHEINNPLCTIKLMAEQAEEVLVENGGEPALALEMLLRISKTVERIAAIVQGLRTFSRNGDNDLMLAVPAKRIVEQTLALCQEKIGNRGIDLRVPAIPENITFACRDVQISQILLNLISNACDAIAPLSERWVELSVAERGEYVEISIMDSGKGMSKKVIDKIFHPFFTTKEIGKGTGLGLSISKGIAESHGGSLLVNQNCPNTMFVLRLPRLDSRAIGISSEEKKAS